MPTDSIDPNLITAQWGLIGAFGVAVTLLAPRADQYRQEYIRSDSDLDRKRTSQWVRLVRFTPVVVLVAVTLLTVLAAPATPPNWTEARREYSILALPFLAQLGFIYILWKLVPSLSLKTVELQVGAAFPKSGGSQEATFIDIDNRSNEQLTLWWIDNKGHPVDQERPKLTVAVDDKLKVLTKSGDCWLVRRRNGADVGFFQTKDKPVRGEIDQNAVDAAPEPQVGNLLAVQDILPSSKNVGVIVQAITVVNKAGQLIIVQWIDRYGKPANAPGKVRIPPGEERTWYTWPGHYWLVQTQSGDKIGLVQGQVKPTITEVSRKAVDSVAHSSEDR
jgi:hypothetical protein